MKHSLFTLVALVSLIVPARVFSQQKMVSVQPSSTTQAAIPHLIKFSGRLPGLDGKPLVGPVDVTFSLYADESGGAPLWFEAQTVEASSLGRYTILLGAMTPQGLPIELFAAGEAHWLGVMVRGLPEQPRVLLVSVPYALKAGDAETLGGKPASAYMLATQAATQTAAAAVANAGTLSGQVQSSALTSGSTTPKAVTMTAGYIPVFTDESGGHGNSLMFQLGSRIGVGTATPSVGFDLNSNIFAIGPTAPLPGGGGTMRFRDDTGTMRWLFGLPGTAGSQDFQMYNYTNGHAPIYIENAAPSYSFYFKGNGNVGIGTNNPAAKLDVVGAVKSSGTVTGTQLVSTVAVGTPPLSVTSTTQVPNLNASLLGGYGTGAFQPAGSYATTGTNTFSATQTITSGDITIGGGNLSLPATDSAGTAGVITLDGNRFIHAFGSENTFVGGDAGNFSTTGTSNTAIGYQALPLNSTGTQNTAAGAGALGSNTAGGTNTAVGGSALQANTDSSGNTAIGFYALGRNCLGVFGPCPATINTALGYFAGVTVDGAYPNQTGAHNTFLGAWSGPGTTSPITNATAIGYQAVVSQSNALVLGSISGVNGATDSANVGIGTATPERTLDVVGTGRFSGAVTAASFVGDGSELTGIPPSTANGLDCVGCVSSSEVDFNYAASASKGGDAANALLLGGSPASAFQPAGTYATLGANTFTTTQTLSGGDLAVSAGNVALPPTTGSSAGALKIGSYMFVHACCGATKFNTFVGPSSGNTTMTATNSTGIGNAALHANTTGNDNTALGSGALSANTTGYENTAGGSGALISNALGSWNTALGYAALYNNSDADYNTAVGFQALSDNCSGAASGCAGKYNSAFGSRAGQSGTAANANKTGDHNTFLGAFTGPGSTTQLTNATAIGANAIVARDNALVLGSVAGLNGGKASINVGIGTANPTTSLQVAGGDMSTVSAGKGLIVKSPDGTKCARIGIDNTGAVVATPISCP